LLECLLLSRFETTFVSAAHTPVGIAETVDAARLAFQKTVIEVTGLMQEVE
jgi:glutamate-1-semialdehyde aminotransferase